MNRDFIAEARRRFPKFSVTYLDDDGIYMLYGALGSFMLDVINLRYGDNKMPSNYYFADVGGFYDGEQDLDEEIHAYFAFIDELFEDGEGVRDVLNTCIFESLMGNDFSCSLARKYLSRDCYNHYLDVIKK